MGPRDLENGTIELARRDTLEKKSIGRDDAVKSIPGLLEEIQQSLYQKALDFRTGMIKKIDTWEQFKTEIEKGGFLSAHWDGTAETEQSIKEQTKATIRCIPLDATEEIGTCVYSGKASNKRVLFAKAY
jgi:prolyl-tRNA synthetase